jgi:uncharacterized membrane protein YagU involved in acid resistance
MNKVLRGALAGLAATVPMTAVMEILHRWPRPERQSLPPRQITMHLAGKAGVRSHMNEPERKAATVASHFGFGGGAGALYALLAGKVPGHPALKGAVFGLLVWTVSYLGWLPAAQILRSATQQPARRNALMIGAHLVWGAILGVLAERGSNEPQD